MKILIHDLEEELFQRLYPDIDKNIKVISDRKNIKNCIGCFGCWVKTPGVCVIKDEYHHMGEDLAKSDELIIMSECFYGGYSPFVKNVIDKSINYVLPFFTIRNKEMHHVPRYNNELKLTVYIYGENISLEEKQTMDELVGANAINLDIKKHELIFLKSIEELPRERRKL